MANTIPPRKDIMSIAGEASVDPRTVRSAYEGNDIRELTFERIKAAAKKLKLTAPPAPKAK